MDKSVPRVTVWHHSVEPQNNGPWDRFVHPYLTLMPYSYILYPKFTLSEQAGPSCTGSETSKPDSVVSSPHIV